MTQAKASPAEGTSHIVSREEASCDTPGCYVIVYRHIAADGSPYGAWYHDDTGRTTCVVRTERRGRHAASERTPRI